MERTLKEKKQLISGETITEEIIPTGDALPNIKTETGIVKACALSEAANDEAVF